MEFVSTMIYNMEKYPMYMKQGNSERRIYHVNLDITLVSRRQMSG